MDDPHPADHGEFQLQTSFNDDLKLLRESMVQARRNPERPGHHWHRIVAKGTTRSETIEVIKYYHVDLNRGVAEITETTNGKETARRTLDLAHLG